MIHNFQTRGEKTANLLKFSDINYLCCGGGGYEINSNKMHFLKANSIFLNVNRIY